MQERSIAETILDRSEFPPIAHSIEQLSQATTLSKAFLRKEIRAGRLKATRFGRRVLVLHADLLVYLSRK